MNLQNMAPNAKKSLMVSAVFALLAAGIYFGAVEPAIAERDSTAKKLAELQSQESLMGKNLAGANKIISKISDLEAGLAVYDEAMLEPLLESLSMRAKSILDPIAMEMGLEDVNYTELETIPLPVPAKLPAQLHARQPIKVTATGTYQGAVSFLMRVENTFPLVILESFTITSMGEPDHQTIEMIFEWPVKGKVTKVIPPKNGGK